MTQITTTEIIEALREAIHRAPQQDGTITSGELARALNRSPRTISMVIHQLLADGVIELAQTKRRNVVGRLTTLPAWRLVAPPTARGRSA